MKIINKYIGKQIIVMILIVIIALLGVDLFFHLVNELKFVGKGNYHLSTAFTLIALIIPNELYMMFPWSALLGTILALGQLAKSSELVVMRTAAISIHKIAWATLRSVLLLTIIVFIFGEIISPVFERIARQERIAALSTGQAIQTDNGIWIKEGHEFIHINVVLANGGLQQITRYSFNEKLELQEIIYAHTATQVANGWILNNVTGTNFTKENTILIKQDEFFIGTLLNLEILEVSRIKHLESLSLKYLHKIIIQRVKNGLNVQTYEIALWSKIFQPFSALIMVYLVIPFVFGHLRSSSSGLRLLVGVVVGFAYHVINTIAAQMPMVINMPVVLALSIAPITFCLLGLVNMLRTR
jgi:lipopolysaccharide export system permease protein